MTSSKSCTIKILNKSYDFKCPEAELPNFLLAVQKLNDQIAHNKKKNHANDFQILLLAALDISHELILSKSQQMQVTQFITSLESKINKMVHGENESQPLT